MPIAHFTQFHVIRKVSKPARLVAAGCLVFLVYLLYSYHKLPQQEGGEGGSGQVAFKFYSNFEFILYIVLGKQQLTLESKLSEAIGLHAQYSHHRP